jgi:hypothetical protein
MSEWPADPNLDAELKRLFDAEVAGTDSREIRLRTRSGRGGPIGAAVAIVAVVAIVGALVWRTQQLPGTGEGDMTSSPTPSLALSTLSTPEPTVTPTLTPTPEPSFDATPAPTPEGSFEPGTTMACWRYRSASVTLADGRVLVIGGCEATGGLPVGSSEIYDPATRKFSVTGSLSVEREFETATLLEDGRVLVAAGEPVDVRTPQNGPRPTAELYDPKTGRFTPAGNMVDARQDGAMVRLGDGKVLIVGGDAPSTAELYDPATGRFTATGPMAAPMPAFAHGVLLQDGRAIFIGSDKTGMTTILEIYDPAAGTFSLAGSLTVNRADFMGAALLPDGKVLIAGSDPNSTVDIFDPQTATLAPGPKMARPLDVFTCTSLADGRVLFLGTVIGEKQPKYGLVPRAGGELFDRREPTGQARVRLFGTIAGPFNITGEIFDPRTSQFTYLGHLNVQRTEFGADLLLDGRVLIVGGASDTAELFDPATGKFKLNGK